MMELCFLIINNEFLAFSFIYQSELEKAALINNLPYRFLIDMDLKQLRIHVTRKLNTGLSVSNLGLKLVFFRLKQLSGLLVICETLALLHRVINRDIKVYMNQ